MTIRTVHLTLLAVGVFYAILAFRILSPDAIYTVDVAVKHVQAQSLIDNRLGSLDIPYRGEAFDPYRRFVPFRAPYVMSVGDQVQAIWSSSTAVFNAAFVRLWGYRGMVLASLMSALVVLAVSARLAAVPGRAAVPIVLGLGTPLWFFATIGWEHAPAVAFAMLALLAIWKRPDRLRALAAGLLLGAGAALRGEVGLLAPGLGFAIWILCRDWRSVAAFAAGIGVVLSGASAVEVWWFHRPLAAHASYTSNLLRQMFQLPQAIGVEPLTPYTLRERYSTVIQYWLLGYYNNLAIACAAGVLGLGWMVRRRSRASWPVAVAVAAAIVLAAWDAWSVLRAPRWIAGAYRLSPFLLFAVMPPPLAAERRDRWQFITLATAVSYLVIAMAGTDLAGGKGFPRLLLPILPLLSVAAWRTIGAYLGAPGATDRWIGRLGLALVGLALAIQLGGMIPAYIHHNAAQAAVIDTLDRSAESIVVADDATMAMSLLPLYYRKTILLADTEVMAAALADTLDGWDVRQMMMVSRNRLARFDLTGYDGSVILENDAGAVMRWTRSPSDSSPPPPRAAPVVDLIDRLPDAVDRLPAPEAFSVIDATIAGVRRPAILVQRPTAARIVWSVTVPDRAWLEVGLALPEQTWTAGEGLMFMIGIAAGGDYQQPMMRVVNPAANARDRQWREVALDLGKYAGQTIRIGFNTRWWTETRDGSTGNLALWGTPRIVVR